MNAKPRHLELLQIPRLSAVRVDLSKPVMTLRIPTEIIDSNAYETFEYTSLGFTDTLRNTDGSINASRNFQAFVDCIRNYQELLGILEIVRTNFASLFGKEPELKFKNPWELFIDVPAELALCVQQKFAENPDDGISYNENRLAFSAGSFAELADLMKGFFQGCIEP